MTHTNPTCCDNSDNANLNSNHPRQVSNYITRSEAIHNRSAKSPGLPMAACSPLPLLTRPSASGTPRPLTSSTPSLATLAQSGAWLGHPMAACSPPPLVTTPFACGILQQDDKYALSRAIQIASYIYPSPLIAVSWLRNPTMQL